MSLVGVRVEVPSNQPIVLLRENDGQRYLPIFIGQPEATAIVYALQGTETPRPMTHDLFKSVLDDLGTKVLQVVITELHDGTFFAEIEFARDGGIEQDEEEEQIEQFREFLDQVRPEDFAAGEGP
jgi:bifunctional DNase/RNase